MVELKSCPFCNGEAEITETRMFSHQDCYVQCKCCGACTKFRFGDECRKQAIDDWNTRYETSYKGSVPEGMRVEEMKVTSKYEVEITIEEDVTQEYLPNLKEVYEGNTTKMLELRKGIEYDLGKEIGGVVKVKSQVIISNLGKLDWRSE